jgi:hypothetical protein
MPKSMKCEGVIGKENPTTIEFQLPWKNEWSKAGFKEVKMKSM